MFLFITKMPHKNTRVSDTSNNNNSQHEEPQPPPPPLFFTP